LAAKIILHFFLRAFPAVLFDNPYLTNVEIFMIDTLERKLMAVPNPEEENNEQEKEEYLDPRVLSSVLVSVKLSQIQEEHVDKDPHSRLLELMHSPPVRALLDAAVIYAKREAIPAHEGLQQMVLNLQSIDKLWNQVLLKEGLARLSSQYH
jgi:hypothetical protein